MTRSSKPLPISNRTTGVVRADFAVALGVVSLGIFIAVGSIGISFGVGYDRIGPRFFPYLVAFGLVLLGTWLAGAAFRGRTTRRGVLERAGPGFATNWRALGYLTLALLLNLLLLERAGFVIASAVLFCLAARAFDSQRPVRDAVVAALLSTVVYIAFTRGLGLTLPSGFLP